MQYVQFNILKAKGEKKLSYIHISCTIDLHGTFLLKQLKQRFKKIQDRYLKFFKQVQ